MTVTLALCAAAADEQPVTPVAEEAQRRHRVDPDLRRPSRLGQPSRDPPFGETGEPGLHHDRDEGRHGEQDQGREEEGHDAEASRPRREIK